MQVSWLHVRQKAKKTNKTKLMANRMENAFTLARMGPRMYAHTDKWTTQNTMLLVPSIGQAEV